MAPSPSQMVKHYLNPLSPHLSDVGIERTQLLQLSETDDPAFDFASTSCSFWLDLWSCDSKQDLTLSLKLFFSVLHTATGIFQVCVLILSFQWWSCITPSFDGQLVSLPFLWPFGINEIYQYFCLFRCDEWWAGLFAPFCTLLMSHLKKHENFCTVALNELFKMFLRRLKAFIVSHFGQKPLTIERNVW